MTDSDEFAEVYADTREIESKGALTLPGPLGNAGTANRGQGEFVPVFWSGDGGDFVQISLLSAAGKKLASSRKRHQNPINASHGVGGGHVLNRAQAG